MIQADRAACGLSRRDRRQLRAYLARSQKSGRLRKRKLPGKHRGKPPTRRELRRLWVIALTRPRLIWRSGNCGLKMKPPRTPLPLQNPLTLPLRANLARSRESSGRTAKSPDHRNACGVTEVHRPVVKPPQTVRIPVMALPTKRRRRTASVWRNQSSVWKKAAKS